MVGRLARSLLALMCLGALVGAAVPSGAGAVMVGLSDQGAAMFSDQKLLRLNIRQARLVVFWDVAVMRDKGPLNEARAWIGAAQAAGVTPMISFGGHGNYIPNWRVYRTAVRAFLREFPQVKTYTAWNEPDWIYRPRL
ncbi:MAG TPA: hypothetical protein VE197_07090, partial [Mycobacterium sp.]|nr:hypothetical protein [Mycobacterium sp.]